MATWVGFGKTQLALAYAQRHRKDYELGWWNPCRDQMTPAYFTAFADLGEVLGLRRRAEPGPEVARQRCGMRSRSGLAGC
jgi:hypothetical protein